MTSIRSDPKKQRFPSLQGKLVIDTWRGQIRARAWPRKRGPHKLAKQIAQSAWFKEAHRQAKFCAPSQQRIAIEASKGTGLYPRDILINAMAGGMFDLALPDNILFSFRNPFLSPAMFQGAILEQDTPQSLPVGVYTTLIWPLPVVDTAGMWDVTKPERLTIPAGVEVIVVDAGWHKTGLVQTGTVVPAIRKNGVWISRFPHRSEGWPGGVITSGARVVEEGDFFDFQVFVEDASITDGNPECFMSLTILQTDVA